MRLAILAALLAGAMPTLACMRYACNDWGPSAGCLTPGANENCANQVAGPDGVWCARCSRPDAEERQANARTNAKTPPPRRKNTRRELLEDYAGMYQKRDQFDRRDGLWNDDLWSIFDEEI